MTTTLPDTALLDEIERRRQTAIEARSGNLNTWAVKQNIFVRAVTTSWERIEQLARAGLRVPALEDEVARLRGALEKISRSPTVEGKLVVIDIARAALNPKDPAHG